jgi:multidrug efflux pump subunit AcrA (membrane-fusion protein)
VTVDIALTGSLPKGARPDLNVEGTIDLERIEGVLYVARPSFGSDESTLNFYKLNEHENGAVVVKVKTGRSSLKFIEIRSGLSVGDKVILSDMSAHEGVTEVRLN